MKLYKEINKELGTNFRSSEEINWKNISKEYTLSEEFIKKYQDKVDWNLISRYQRLSESFIRKWINYLDYGNIISEQKLSEEFIESFILKNLKFSRSLYLDYISYYQVLSEGFIEKYKDIINWFYLSSSQKLSKDFVEKHKNRINLDKLNYNLLYNSNINKDWFFAYIDKHSPYSIFDSNKIFRSESNYHLYSLSTSRTILTNITKVRVYYKDLIVTNKAIKFDIIRKVNKYKICGKRDGSI